MRRILILAAFAVVLLGGVSVVSAASQKPCNKPKPPPRCTAPSLTPSPTASPSPTATPRPTPTPSPIPTPTAAPSATPTPTPEGPWELLFSEDFNQTLAEGQFPSAVSDRWFAYPRPWSFWGGTYDPSIISWHDGVMDYRLRVVNGESLQAAALPKIEGPSDKDQLYGRYEVRWRCDVNSDYYNAWLLWPESEVWPRDGEIDFPEGGHGGSIHAFMHRQGATSGGDQDHFATTTPMCGPTWRTAVTEWTPSSVKFYLDGTLIGTSTSRIPNTPMHWVLQTTRDNGGAIPNGEKGHVLIDYVKVWSYSP